MRFPLRNRPQAFLLGLLAGALLLVVVPSGWLFRDPPSKGAMGAAGARRYACPMFCTMQDAPGTCPVCGMEMAPVTDQGEQVRLDAHQRYMVGVRTAAVERSVAVHRVRALGKIRHDERREGSVTAWVGGRLERLFVDFTGVTVAEGAKVAEIYAPELVSAQDELISARRTWEAARRSESPAAEALRRNARNVYDATRRRLRLLGLPDATLDAIEEGGEARDHLDIYANVGGTVIQKHVGAGDYVKTGQPLFTVVGLSNVWAVLDVFEQDAGAVFIGQQVDVAVPSLPGETFRGFVSFVDPVLDEQRRVVRVRVDLPNEDGRLKPGTFVDAHVLVELTSEGRVHDPIPPGAWYSPTHPFHFQAEPGTCPHSGVALVQKPGDPAGRTEAGPVLLAPRSAVLEGGDRQLVYVMTQEPGPVEDGRERWPAIYEPREVRTGFRVGDRVVVLAGLEETDLVVTRGQFLIDSQLQLTGKPSLMIPEAAGARAATDPHAGHGH